MSNKSVEFAEKMRGKAKLQLLHDLMLVAPVTEKIETGSVMERSKGGIWMPHWGGATRMNERKFRVGVVVDEGPGIHRIKGGTGSGFSLNDCYQQKKEFEKKGVLNMMVGKNKTPYDFVFVPNCFFGKKVMFSSWYYDQHIIVDGVLLLLMRATNVFGIITDEEYDDLI